MTYPNPYLQSLDQEILTADPIHLVLMLMRGARQSTEEARQAVLRGQIRERAEAVSRAVERIAELCRNLDFVRGGEIAGRLAQLYDYMIYRLNEANLQQSEAPLAEVSELLMLLVEAWSQLESAAANAPAPALECPGVAMDLCA